MDRLVMQYSGFCLRYCYQPGNGTKYEVIYGPIEADTFMFGWLNRSKGGVVAEFRLDKGLLTFDYFMDKLQITNKADAAALLTLVNELTERPILYPEGYDHAGNCFRLDLIPPKD